MLFRNQKYQLYRAFLAILVALSFLISPIVSQVSAATSSSSSSPNGFSISPVESIITIAQGSSQTVTIYLQNPTTETLVAQPIVNDFEASADESGTPNLILKNTGPLPSNNFRDLVGNIPNVTIPAGKQGTVNVTITVPKNANPGGYYGAIRFVPVSASGQQSNIGLTASVGSLVLLTVPGNLVQKLNLVQLSAEVNGQPQHLFTSGNVGIMTRLNNVGNIHVAPFGKIRVTGMFNKNVALINFNSAKGEILPDSIRRFTDSLPKYHWFGHYTIQANLGYGNKGALITATAGFWYFPTWFIILAILVVIIVVALIYWVVHSAKSRRLRNPHRR